MRVYIVVIVKVVIILVVVAVAAVKEEEKRRKRRKRHQEEEEFSIIFPLLRDTAKRNTKNTYRKFEEVSLPQFQFLISRLSLLVYGCGCPRKGTLSIVAILLEINIVNS